MPITGVEGKAGPGHSGHNDLVSRIQDEPRGDES